MNQLISTRSDGDVCLANSSKWAVGIDPGMKGAIAAVNLERTENKVWPMPVIAGRMDMTRIRSIFSELGGLGAVSLCVLEKAQPMPGQGVVGVFNMGTNYGMLLAVLEEVKAPFEEISPSEWKRSIIGGVKATKKKSLLATDGVVEDSGTVKQQKAANKKALKELAVLTARRLFPDAVFRNTQDGLAEALLMAEAARRIVVSGSIKLPDSAT